MISERVVHFINSPSDTNLAIAEYTELRTKPRARKVTIFVDWASSKPTTSLNGSDPCGNDMVATFDLQKLPFTAWDNIHRKLGGRSTLYVRNFDLAGEHDTTESNAISTYG